MKIALITWLVLTFLVASCGVKGDPVPPERSEEIGRGKPKSKRSSQGSPSRLGEEKDFQQEVFEAEGG